MAQFSATLLVIPVFLESETKEGLIRLMMLNNQLNAKKYLYNPPMFDGKMWVVWFSVDIENYRPVDSASEAEVIAYLGEGEAADE